MVTMQNKSGHLFPPELRTMSIVPRWSICHVTQKDTVANHSYYVAIYSHLIARVIKWQGPKEYLVFMALIHDLSETTTGDLVGPIKEYILDYDKMDDFLYKKMSDRFSCLMTECSELEKNLEGEQADEADAIIKAADRLDAVYFLIMEERRGNTTISQLVHSAIHRLEGAWRELPAHRDVIDRTWQTVVLSSIEAHKSEGGRGV